MIERLVVFGATGDLAGRFLLPAIAALYDSGRLSTRFRVIGAAQKELSSDSFRELAADRLSRHAPQASAGAREAVVNALSYRRVDIADASDVARVIHESADPVACYLALPNALFAKAVSTISSAGLPPGSRIAVEKPFGTDLSDARALNAQLAKIGDEWAVFRVDHALGMPAVRNLIPFRRNRVIDAVWSSEHIEQIDVLWQETLALEDRAAYYDRAGALKDVMQNHMVQVLCAVAMELPDGSDLHDRKIELFRSVRPPRPAEMRARTRRARYTTGRLAGGRVVPDYKRENGVDPNRGTETLAEVELCVDNERWTGTRFVLRAAKAFSSRRKAVVIHFRDGSNELVLGIDGPNDIRWHLDPTTLTAPPPDAGLPAYAEVLSEILEGRSDFSIRGDEAEESWRIFTPVLEAWAAGTVPLEEYAAGSDALPPRTGAYAARSEAGIRERVRP
jgi:glucose-6-phosphate 1-dehydrogenase